MGKIKLENREIEFIMRKSKRAKHVRLSVRRDATVVLTVPARANEKRAFDFLRQKARWVLDKIDFFKLYPSERPLGFRGANYARQKDEALLVVRERLEAINQTFNFKYKKVSIKNQKTRWGSCSAKGNLNFNFKLMFLPPRLRDYIIVHELCHLREFNHSRNFWKLVATAVPDYKVLRRELNKSFCL